MDEAKLVGWRIREVRCWRQLTLREAAGLAGLSFSFWGQVERGEKPVVSSRTLEAMASALRVHPVELTGQPWTQGDAHHPDAQVGLEDIEIALERYELGVDPELSARAWPWVAEDLDRLLVMDQSGDYAGMSELAPVVLGELHAAYLRRPRARPEVLVGLMRAYGALMSPTLRLGGRGLPSLAARAAQRCAEVLDDPVWLGYAAYLRGRATGHLDRAAHYRHSVAAAESLSRRLDRGDAVQACGMLHLSAAFAASARADRDTAATHLAEASALGARMDTEVGTWAHLWFGPTTIGIRKTDIAVELGEHGRALEAAQTVHPELLPSAVMQAGFWILVGSSLVTERKTREEGVGVLLRAEQLAPQRIRHDVFVRETIASLLRQARRDAGGRELRGLAWRMGITPMR